MSKYTDQLLRDKRLAQMAEGRAMKRAGIPRLGRVKVDPLPEKPAATLDPFTGEWVSDKIFAQMNSSDPMAVAIAQSAVAKISRELVTAGEVTKDAVIDAVASGQAEVVLAQQRNAAKVRGIYEKLLSQLDSQVNQGTDIRKLLAKLMEAGKTHPDVIKELKKLGELPAQIKMLTDAVTALGALSKVERQAWGVRDEETQKQLTINITAVDNDL